MDFYPYYVMPDGLLEISGPPEYIMDISDKKQVPNTSRKVKKVFKKCLKH